VSWTVRVIEDEFIVLGSEDAADIGRVFRLLQYDLPVDSGTRITTVYVTIHKEILTEENFNAKINDPQREPDSGARDELPF